MKQIIVFFFFCFSTSCHPRQRETLVFSKYPKELTVENGVLFFKNKKFDGILIQLQQNAKDTLLFQTYSNGEMDGISKKWYPNRQLMEYRQYRKGKKEGKQLAFWDNGKKRMAFTATNDTYQGVLKEWSRDGQLFHLANYKDGQEEGSQKMWYENGKIRANYVILNGKRYGLLGTKNCKNVSNRIFTTQ